MALTLKRAKIIVSALAKIEEEIADVTQGLERLAKAKTQSEVIIPIGGEIPYNLTRGNAIDMLERHRADCMVAFNAYMLELGIVDEKEGA